MLFYVTHGYKLRRFARLAERVCKVIIGLWLRLKYEWLGYGVLGLYKRRKHGYTSLETLINKMYGDYAIQLTPELCICPTGSRPKFGRTNPKFDELLEMFDVRVL